MRVAAGGVVDLRREGPGAHTEQHADGVGAPVGHRQVGPAVAVEVAHHDRVGVGAGGVGVDRGEDPMAVAQQDADAVGVLVEHGQVELAVAEVAADHLVRPRAHRDLGAGEAQRRERHGGAGGAVRVLVEAVGVAGDAGHGVPGKGEAARRCQTADRARRRQRRSDAAGQDGQHDEQHDEQRSRELLQGTPSSKMCVYQFIIPGNGEA